MTNIDMRFALIAFAAIFAFSASALTVNYDDRTPKENREWADRSYIREQMVVVAEKICKVLYGGTKNENIVSTTPIPLPPTPTKNSNSSPGSTAIALAAAVPHSLILSVKGGDAAAVIVEGKPVAKIDMKAKCKDCAFAPVFAVGGMSGGFGVAGFSEPRGADGVLLDDVRVFTRAFRAKESASYAATFGPEYRGAEVCYKNSKTRQMQFKGNAI